MNDKNPYSPETWQLFLDLVEPDLDSLTQEEVRQELRASGIDCASVLDRVKSSIQKHADRAALTQASQKRERLLRPAPGPLDAVRKTRDALLDEIRKLIDPVLAQVYMNKMEKAASDNDLSSLLEDLQEAKKLNEDFEEDNGTPET